MLLDFSRLGYWRLILSGFGLAAAAFLLLPIAMIITLSFGSSQ
jgi:putative spermidine/putrescine transport system permease protein